MKNYLFFCALFIIGFENVNAQLQNTGWKRPTALHAPNGWTNPQNAFSSDDQYAEVVHQSGCRCPFMDLSWNDGTSWTSSNIFGPYGTSDSWKTEGDSTDNWGHAWTDSELSDSIFVLRIWNSSTLIKQGYSNFGFGIPSGSTISGIEIHVEAHGDSNYTYDYVDAIEMRVYYSLPTAVPENKILNTQVYPNPANGKLNLRFSGDTQSRIIKLISLQGLTCFEKEFRNIIEGDSYAIDVSKLAAGVYILNSVGRSNVYQERIIIR